MGRSCEFCDKEGEFYFILRHEKKCKADYSAMLGRVTLRNRIVMAEAQRRLDVRRAEQQAQARRAEEQVQAAERLRKQIEDEAIEAELARLRIHGEEVEAEAVAALEAKWKTEGYSKTKFEEAEEAAARLMAAKSRAQLAEDYAPSDYSTDHSSDTSV